ncbi:MULTISPECIES: sodium:proline symporter [unclassified Halorubrum]|uniref:sodium:solute symporter family transporter n=1 Tax=unclassified Halorubrum TaxID=2642239 RepID=UPI000678CC88|nr:MULTISPECIES: sodium:proline symporter [unclassified Halorubrum]
MVSTAVALTAVVLTVLTVTAFGLLAARGRVRSVEDYISARDSAGPGTLTATIIASMMGVWILFSPAEAGAAFGGLPAILGYAIGSAVPLLLFIPVGTRIRAIVPAGHSLTEFAYARFGTGMYLFVLVVSVFYMFIFLAAEMTGIAGALSLVIGIPQWQTALLVGGFVLIYTAYGGLVASIVTDTVQTLVLLPLLALGFGGAVLALGGTAEIHAAAIAADAPLLDPTFGPGLTFGVYVAFAILGANMLNQGMWQRVYAANGESSLRWGFGVAAVAVTPMILLAGLFGIAAAALGLTESGGASIAFFLVLESAFPSWVTLTVVVLAVLLVMSSADTMFNAIASVVTADLARLLDQPTQRALWVGGRVLTGIVGIGAIVIGSQGYSVLELFLTADLLAAGIFVPFLAGLYSERLSGAGAIVSSLGGLVVGVAYFPLLRGPVASIPRLGPLLPAPEFLPAFVGATVVSTGGTILAIALWDADVDLSSVDRDIRSLDEPVADGGPNGGENQ